MSDNQEAESLPTAAVAEYVDRPDPTANSLPSLEVWPKGTLYEIEERTELVRRSDVEALIQDKIEEWENSGHCKDQYGDRPLKELLDEVQKQ